MRNNILAELWLKDFQERYNKLQSKRNKNVGDVVNLAKWCKDSLDKDSEKEQETYSFSSVIEQNKEKAEKLAKERAKANVGVTKSYRLKKDK